MESDGLTQKELNEINAIVRQWAMDREHELIANVRALGLVKTGKLMRSIKAHVRIDQGEASAVAFRYEYYGLFHDHGADNVGRGRIILPAGHWMVRHMIGGDKIDKLLEDLSEYYINLMIQGIRLDDKKGRILGKT